MVAVPSFVPSFIKTPCYVVDKSLLENNLKILKNVQKRTECKILLALKAFSMYSLFPLINKYLCGTTASSLNEARLGSTEFGGEVHICAPAYRDDEINDILKYASHITFNSISQWDYFGPSALAMTKACALRINPEHSEVNVPIYDPCAPKSRLGIRLKDLKGKDITGVKGLHFHTLCELNSDSLERTLKVVEDKFGRVIEGMEFVNFGGGHHITRPDYDVEKLCALITDFKRKYNVEIYLEPGEAVVLNAGFLVATVLDIINNEIDIAIIDTSASCHMPDVMIMPYRPDVVGAGLPGEHKYTYRLGGMTCLSGDVIGEYSFKEPLKIGDRVTFLDMAHYSMVKNTTFNGVNLPSIAIYDKEKDRLKVVKDFSYDDYKNRLS